MPPFPCLSSTEAVGNPPATQHPFPNASWDGSPCQHRLPTQPEPGSPPGSPQTISRRSDCKQKSYRGEMLNLRPKAEPALTHRELRRAAARRRGGRRGGRPRAGLRGGTVAAWLVGSPPRRDGTGRVGGNGARSGRFHAHVEPALTRPGALLRGEQS